MNMKYSKYGIMLTERFESCRLVAYQDVKGVWTIGYGHTGPEVVQGLRWTQLQADSNAVDDMHNSECTVNRVVKVNVVQNEFDALVDFDYNVGGGALERSTLLKDLNNGDFAGAAAQFDSWDHADGKVVAGLLRRRQAETTEFTTPSMG